jgi:hypothetical protein
MATKLEYDRASELKAFDETKDGVKGSQRSRAYSTMTLIKIQLIHLQVPPNLLFHLLILLIFI